MLREDYLLKLVRQAAEAIARALKLTEEEQLDGAERELGEAWQRLLKMPRDLFFMLDERTVSESIGDVATVRVAARACVAEALLLERRGQAAAARSRFRRALSLYGHVGVGDLPEDEAALAAAKAATAP